MGEYRQNAINHLKTHLGCVGYRDYLIAELEKIEQIEQIVNCELIAGRRNYKSCYNAFYEIVDVIQDKEILEKE